MSERVCVLDISSNMTQGHSHQIEDTSPKGHGAHDAIRESDIKLTSKWTDVVGPENVIKKVISKRERAIPVDDVTAAVVAFDDVT